MKKTYHPANERGLTKIDWLDSKHSFSFGGFYDEKKMGWGVLRVLNDDQILPQTGFGEHGHKDMEIISIPLKGRLSHQDSEGNQGDIVTGEVQMMSAGRGIRHSEYNHSQNEDCHFLQIWITPKEVGIKPRYQQDKFDFNKKNSLVPLVSNGDIPKTIKIIQDAFIHHGFFKAGETVKYDLINKQNLLYVFVLEGEVQIEDQLLKRRDALAIETKGESSLTLKTESEAKFLIFELPE